MSEQELKKKLEDEDLSSVYCSELPESSEYSDIIYKAQECGKYLATNFEKSNAANSESWHKLMNVMAACIARGKRLAKEVKDANIPTTRE